MLEDGLYRVRVCVGVSRVIPRTLPYKQRGGRQESQGPLNGSRSLGFGRTTSSVLGMLTLRLPSEIQEE